MINFGIYIETLYSRFQKIMMKQRKKEIHISIIILGMIKTLDIL